MTEKQWIKYNEEGTDVPMDEKYKKWMGFIIFVAFGLVVLVVMVKFLIINLF